MGFMNFVRMVYDNIMFAQSQKYHRLMGRVQSTQFDAQGNYYMTIVDQENQKHIVYAPTAPKNDSLRDIIMADDSDRTWQGMGFSVSMSVQPGDYVDLDTYKDKGLHHKLVKIDGTYTSPDFMRTKQRHGPFVYYPNMAAYRN